ncbi:PKD domain-containing protein [Cellulomonas sp. JH27-2]|uniref:PKD domain-containing protein n=1 Tax=Cellulomonas sp. JH27-2 TaxID=2774139 RepID=UPI001CD8B224|nr:PKD domain-containing protein [Cellulomonas sp. JH27-2]
MEEPVANMIPSASVSVKGSGMSYTFDASNSKDHNGSIAKYEWTFDDGTSAEGAIVSHTFTAEGSHAANLVVTDDDGDEGFANSSIITATAATPARLPAIYSGSSLSLTNSVTTVGGDVMVRGDVTCNSGASVGGDLVATGDVYLTNTCHVEGSIRSGGSVTMNSSVRVDGDIDAKNAVSLTRGVRIAGEVRAGSVGATDGTSLAALISSGAVGGVVTGATAAPLALQEQAVVPVDPSAYPSSVWKTWTNFVNEVARSGAAPSWSPGLTTAPGCVISPSPASVNTSSVLLSGSSVIDARQPTSGCATVSLQQLTLRLTGDVTILASSARLINGVRVESADGKPHQFTIAVPGASGVIAVPNGLTTDARISVTLRAPGEVSIEGHSDMRGAISGGAVKMTGSAAIRD